MTEAHTVDRGILPDEEPIGTTLARTCVGCGVDYEWTSRPGYQWPTSYCTRSCKSRCSPKRRTRLDVPADAGSDVVLLICGRCETPFGWTPRPDATGTLTPPTYHSATCQKAAAVKRRKDKARAEARDETERQQRAEEQARIDQIAAMSAAARELLLPAARCETCGKVANLTKEAAKDAKRAIEQRSGRTNPVRYYQCDDGWWHWTRMDATLDGFRARQAEHLMSESPASLRHRGRGGWRQIGEVR